MDINIKQKDVFNKYSNLENILEIKILININ